MPYPQAIYKTGEAVMVGDYVRFRIWSDLWLNKREGRVLFVPGISPPNESMEFNGLKWIAVRYAGNTEVGFLVAPDSGITKSVRLVRRTDDQLVATPDDYEFPEDDK